jgi:hypothetical protein
MLTHPAAGPGTLCTGLLQLSFLLVLHVGWRLVDAWVIGLKQRRCMRHNQWVRPPERQANDVAVHTMLMKLHQCRVTF